MSKCTNTCVNVFSHSMFHLSFEGCLVVRLLSKLRTKVSFHVLVRCIIYMDWCGHGWMDGCGWVERRIGG